MRSWVRVVTQSTPCSQVRGSYRQTGEPFSDGVTIRQVLQLLQPAMSCAAAGH